MDNVFRLEAIPDPVPFGILATRTLAESIRALPSEEHGPRFAFILEGHQVLDFKEGAEDFLKKFPYIYVIGRSSLGMLLVMIKQKFLPEEIRDAWDEECFGALFHLIVTCGFRGELLANDEAQKLIGTQLT